MFHFQHTNCEQDITYQSAQNDLLINLCEVVAILPAHVSKNDKGIARKFGRYSYSLSCWELDVMVEDWKQGYTASLVLSRGHKCTYQHL